MSFDWLSSKKPLDVIARTIEEKYIATGKARRAQKDASAWGEDPSRPAAMRTMFKALLVGRKDGRTERYVFVKQQREIFAYVPPSKYDDADYLSRPYNKRFLEDPKRFTLKLHGRSIESDALSRLFGACATETSQTYTPGNRSITLENLSVIPLIRPRFVHCLPLPSKPGKLEWRCTASGATWQAMLGLARAFGGTRPPTVLVTGPPGSGKEAYAKAVHFGQKRNAEKSDRHLVALSLGEVGAEELRRRLGGGLLDRLQKESGTLFLDEVDKASSGVRSSLLRILENREYEDKSEKVRQCDAVAFAVAAGRPLAALRGEEPPDFWTRMEVHIPVADPLTAGSQEERRELLSAFFRFFWWDTVSDWLEGYRGDAIASARDSKWSAFLREKDFLVNSLFPVAIGKMGQDLKFKSSDPIESVAEHFASVLAPHLERRQLSVRGLRTAVGAVQRATRAQLAAMAIVGDKQTAVNKFKDVARQAIHEAVGTVLQVLPDDYEARGRFRT